MSNECDRGLMKGGVDGAGEGAGGNACVTEVMVMVGWWESVSGWRCWIVWEMGVPEWADAFRPSLGVAGGGGS